MNAFLPTYNQTRLAEFEGFAAQRMGKSVEDNPWKSLTSPIHQELSRQWQQGFSFAESEK